MRILGWGEDDQVGGFSFSHAERENTSNKIKEKYFTSVKDTLSVLKTVMESNKFSLSQA